MQERPGYTVATTRALEVCRAMKTIPLAAFLICGLPGLSLADDAEDAFVEANILGIFYHELGHAIIDVMDLPVLGQEEDAADVASILLIDTLFEPDTAVDLAYDAAFGFAAEAMLSEGEEPAWWDVHGTDPQRYYNTVCLFYGGDPENREGFAEDMELPEDRAETCAEEYELAVASWGPVLDTLSETDGHALEWQGGRAGFDTDVLQQEVTALNESYAWPEVLVVTIAECGEANAFYDPDARSITLCEEFEPYLRALYRQTR